ncbi:N-acetylmuramoyl-L-alanine amidase [Rhodococcus triatomae]|uniref:N-acetylmuramoyl-L-alanine amidase n=1 Tax=Rhodococcus triatomae TaxID=300028 RepID=A0A1G8ADR9_9NOCA|nr:N-acetylmuramoyl-L-alanine amidase [Rhodococcus triatomae]QNG17795.1 N-acetylmuramoyl-L-alanine amidase [Rhodococcus triatomae]QNG22537.1 N-acetylmuramoyl-L-alanine amidase [Rhodococcus triatomae]SDH19068.1 N-acetylmuramoyl-L-alanine amidase [Rhodococcus triatomae]
MKRSLISLCAGVLAASLLIPATAGAEPEVEPATGTELAGKTVFLDPGHQGSSEGHDLSRQVDDGRGGTKDCQTSGMTTIGGVPEHTITWNVTQLVRSGLETLGADVVLSRADDTGWGGCIDERAAAANASGADLAVSIHADSTDAAGDPSKHGFHMIVPALPIPNPAADAAQSGPGLEASTMMRDAYLGAGFTPANYAGVVDGIQTRSDVAGPALTEVPLVFVEMGNGSHPDDAARLESTDGQLDHAIAVTTGIVTYLLTGGQASAAPAAPGTTEPGATVPGTTEPGTVSPGPVTPDENPLSLESILAMLSDLLAAGGLTGLEEIVNSETIGMLSDLAGELLATVLAQLE